MKRKYYAVWTNGGSLSAGPYRESLGFFDSKDEAQKAFTAWRAANPASFGWRSNAWME